MIYIGIPSYDGKMHHSTVGGLFNVAYGIGKERVPVCLDVIPHDCFIGHARNLMAKRFLSIPDATDMVMIDADVGFSASDFDALMKVKADIVCGVYPFKKDDEHYPVAAVEPLERKGRLVKLIYGPAGFMRIRRGVLEKLKEKVEVFQDENHGLMHDFFPCGRDGFVFRGEDNAFCKLSAQNGFEVWGLEGLELFHTGDKTWKGNWKGESRGAVTKTLRAA